MNILYIIAGLVIVLLIGILLWRRLKARHPRYLDTVSADNNVSKSTEADIISQASESETDLAENVLVNTTKFDSVTVAQRFIDQQKYDKAVETLDRGLLENPYDNQLLLKLLHVYAITNQHDGFYTAYNTIQTYGDVSTLEQAENLKDLLDPDKRSQSINSAIVTTDSLSLEDELNLIEDFDSSSKIDVDSDNSLIDFDVTGLYISDDESVESKDIERESEGFDLTLADLEKTVIDDDTAENIFELSENINDEPTLDIDLSVDDLQSLDFDDAIDLNFNDLVKDDETTLTQIQESINLKHSNQFSDIEALSLENLDYEDDSTTDSSQNEQSSENVVLPEQILEDAPSNESAPVVDEITLSNDSDNDESQDDLSTLVFDDNTLFDDDFDFDALSTTPTATTPVSTDDNSDEQESDTIENAIVDNVVVDDRFAAQFAADFDFVNILDNQQVTLDLAEQYLQLGEYDSAKRLLSEVIEQGSNEQQQLAQELMSRTA